MGKEIGCSFKYNRSKISTPTLKKPVLSSSADHKLYTSNLTRTIISSQLENEDSNAIQNKPDTSNTDDMHSCVTPRKKATVSRPHLHPLVWHHSTKKVSIAPFELQKTTKLPPVGEEYLCFQVNSKSHHAIATSGNSENPYVKLMSTRLVHRELGFIYRYDRSDLTYVYS